jgi:hypothetical protein
MFGRVCGNNRCGIKCNYVCMSAIVTLPVLTMSSALYENVFTWLIVCEIIYVIDDAVGKQIYSTFLFFKQVKIYNLKQRNYIKLL